MQRRTFLATAVATLAASTVLSRAVSAQIKGPNKTRWQVRASEGFDAIAFLGPLSGAELYTRFYGADATEFGAKLPEANAANVVQRIATLEQGRCRTHPAASMVDGQDRLRSVVFDACAVIAPCATPGGSSAGS